MSALYRNVAQQRVETFWIFLREFRVLCVTAVLTLSLGVSDHHVGSED